MLGKDALGDGSPDQQERCLSVHVEIRYLRNEVKTSVGAFVLVVGQPMIQP